MSHDRFFLDHGAIHDRMTRKHVGMQAEIGWQPRLLSLLNDMWEQITALERSGRTVAAPSPSLGEPDDVLDWQALAKAENAEEVFMAFPRKTLVLCIKIFCDELERRASPTAAQGQKPVAIPMSVHEAAQACVDNFLPTTAHPTFKDGLLRKIEQYFAPLFASPVPADGWIMPEDSARLKLMVEAIMYGEAALNAAQVKMTQLGDLKGAGLMQQALDKLRLALPKKDAAPKVAE